MVYPIKRETIEDLPVEIVERKGLGHPDSICDGVVDHVALYLTRYYYENFGMPLHFNVDKAVLVGGRAQPRFGGGEVLDPIIIHIVGRATTRVKTKDGDEVPIPIGALVLGGIRDYIKENFRYLDPSEHIIIEYDIRPGSADLVSLFDRMREEGVPLANDTSLGVGFAPLSETERICLEIERYLNSKEMKKKYPAIGEDIKVMCVRKKDKIDITLAMAVISKEIRDLDAYKAFKEEIREVVLRYAHKFTDKELSLKVNTADDLKSGNVYITVTGTSAESGDDGQVGRGNRVNGLITPMRPMSIEAAAGKNAVSHVGKIYQVVANMAAKKIYEQVSGIEEVYVMLVSRIGEPINKPQIVNVQYIPEKGSIGHGNIRSEIEGILQEILDYLPKFWLDFLKGGIRVF